MVSGFTLTTSIVLVIPWIALKEHLPITILINVNHPATQIMTKSARIAQECARRVAILASRIGLQDYVYLSALKTLHFGLTSVDH